MQNEFKKVFYFSHRFSLGINRFILLFIRITAHWSARTRRDTSQISGGLPQDKPRSCWGALEQIWVWGQRGKVLGDSFDFLVFLLYVVGGFVGFNNYS